MKTPFICLLISLCCNLFINAQDDNQPFTVRFDNDNIPTFSKNPYITNAYSPFFGNNNDFVQIPIATQITFKTQEIVDPSYATNGQIIRLQVVSNVVIDGQVVIRANTMALGQIKVFPPTVSKPGSVAIEVTSVPDVNGSTIALNGKQNITSSNMVGMPATVPAELFVIGYTMNVNKVAFE